MKRFCSRSEMERPCRVLVVKTGRYLACCVVDGVLSVFPAASRDEGTPLARAHAQALAATWWAVTGDGGVEIEECE